MTAHHLSQNMFCLVNLLAFIRCSSFPSQNEEKRSVKGLHLNAHGHIFSVLALLHGNRCLLAEGSTMKALH